MENGGRIEAKLDRLIEQVADVRESLAAYNEKTASLETRFSEYVAHGRFDSCRIARDVPSLCDKVDQCVVKLDTHEKMLDCLHEDIGDIKGRFRFMRWLWVGTIGLLTATGAVIGILAAVHAI